MSRFEVKLSVGVFPNEGAHSPSHHKLGTRSCGLQVFINEAAYYEKKAAFWFVCIYCAHVRCRVALAAVVSLTVNGDASTHVHSLILVYDGVV